MTDSAALGELVTFKNRRQYHHDGILYRSVTARTTIVHVHGSYGNFYQNEFLRVMARTYIRQGINLLAFNLAGHDGVAEAYRFDWDFEYTGGALSQFGRCIEDIQAAVDYVSAFSDYIVLQGHSMGCDRVLYYLIETKERLDAIMLSPCNSYQLQANWLFPDSVESQVQRLKGMTLTDDQWDWLPINAYGIKQADWDYPIPITRHALLDLMQGPAFRLIRPDRPTDFYLDQRCLVYLGGDDTLQTCSRVEMLAYFKSRVRDLSIISEYPDGDHSLWGCEQEVANEIVTWVISNHS